MSRENSEKAKKCLRIEQKEAESKKISGQIYNLFCKFNRLLIIAVLLGAGTSAVGVYLSYYLDGATGGVIVCLQTLLFLMAFLFAPKYGLVNRRMKKAGKHE